MNFFVCVDMNWQCHSLEGSRGDGLGSKVPDGNGNGACCKDQGWAFDKI